MCNEESIISKWSADVYDQNETETDDVDFLLSVIGTPPKKILEVCCGSGRICVPLAKAGYTVSGFDADPIMLDKIQKKAEGLSTIEWHKSDAVHDDWGHGFDVVVLAGNILYNIISDMDYKKAQELFIKKAASALAPGGYVYIAYGPGGHKLIQPPKSYDRGDEIVWQWEGTDSEGNVGKEWVTAGSFDAETNINTFKRGLELTLISGKKIMREKIDAKHFAKLNQIHTWLSNSGFIIEFEYEDFDKNPINEDSRQVIIYARKTEEITYVPIDEIIERKIIAWFGNAIAKYDMLPKRDGCYHIAAICGEEIVGFAAISPARWTPPPEQYNDAFIHSIEVAEPFRRRGIGRRLITMLEDVARENGYRQIRAWSSYESPAALHMWYAMGYAMCPATEPIYENDQIRRLNPGYYYAKILNLMPKK